MATIQSKMSRGHKYWYIVESRRVNGKPRPVVLAYLGKADQLLKRLQGIGNNFILKSYSHGAIASLLKIASDLDIVSEINKHINSPRPYFSSKPLRNELTAGITLLSGAIGRICMPTSKRGWWNWAKTTSCEYLLRTSLKNVDSQHFWDLMDALPVNKISEIEQTIVQRVLHRYKINTNSIFYDTTNFFTYIHTTNTRCTIAQRGKNKQKRSDLRQIGLAIVVNQEDGIPLFHLTYQGNRNDSKVFSGLLSQIKSRITAIGLDVKKHTLVFDRGNNSKENLALIKKDKLFYVGALTPKHHQDLIADSENNYQEVIIDNNELPLMVYREKKTIWLEQRTVVVFISARLKQGQLRGVYQSIEKIKSRLEKLKTSLTRKNKKRTKSQVQKIVERITRGQYMEGLFTWEIGNKRNGCFKFNYKFHQNKLNVLEDKLGFRIIMTNRHNWETRDIIKTYYGQAKVENAFRNIKNPHHLAVRPQYHWTDQKIQVHFFICVLGYLLVTIILREVKAKTSFSGSVDKLVTILNNIRLAAVMEKSGTKGRMKTLYKLETMDSEEQNILKSLEVDKYHEKKPQIDGVGVYT